MSPSLSNKVDYLLSKADVAECNIVLAKSIVFDQTEAKAAAGKPLKQKNDRSKTLRQHAALTDDVPFPHPRIGVHIFVADSPCNPSTAPQSLLKNIKLADLCIGVKHYGQALIVRMIARPKRFAATFLVVDDEDGSVDTVLVYEHSNQPTALETAATYTYLCIKEPFYRLTEHGTLIHVDHPTDVVRMPPIDLFDVSLDPTSNKAMSTGTSTGNVYKDKGNAAWRSGNHCDALRQYDLGIMSDGGKDVLLTADLYRNRARVNIKLQRYENAVADAKASLLRSTDPIDAKARKLANIKAFILAGHGAYGSRDFSAAKTHFESALHLDPTQAEASRELTRSISRLNESKTGNYDFKQLLSSVSPKSYRLDVADYTSKIQLRSTDHRTFGLFAAKPIRQGETVFVEKALAATCIEDPDIKRNQVLLESTGELWLGRYVKLWNEAFTSLRYSQEMTKALLKTADLGPHGPQTLQTSEDGAMLPFYALKDLMMKKHRSSCQHISSADQLDGRPAPGLDDMAIDGVWMNLGHLRHACDANITARNIGDVCFVTAVRNIASGEQLTRMRTDGSLDHFEITRKNLAAKGVDCHCRICTVELLVPAAVRQRREAIIDKDFPLPARFSSPRAWFKAAVTYIKNVEGTLSTTLYQGKPRICLFWSYSSIASILAKIGRKQEELEYICLAMASMGVQIILHGDNARIDCSRIVFDEKLTILAKRASQLLADQGKAGAARAANALARDLFKAWVGHTEGFDEMAHVWMSLTKRGQVDSMVLNK